VLDSLHLTRQLMLAAPVLNVGLPTLVLLNMSDLMKRAAASRHAQAGPRTLRAGRPDQRHARHRPRCRLALPQPARQRHRRQAAGALPVMGNAASAHTWAAQVSRRTGYKAPLSVEGTRKIDNILLHRIWGPLLFLAVVIGVFEVVFSIGQPLSDGFGDILARIGELPARCCPPAGCNRWCSTAHGRASPPCSSSCRRFCCCFSLSGSSKTPATWPAPR
jgi:ferrous iron transport protein B